MNTEGSGWAGFAAEVLYVDLPAALGDGSAAVAPRLVWLKSRAETREWALVPGDFILPDGRPGVRELHQWIGVVIGEPTAEGWVDVQSMPWALIWGEPGQWPARVDVLAKTPGTDAVLFQMLVSWSPDRPPEVRFDLQWPDAEEPAPRVASPLEGFAGSLRRHIPDVGL